MKAHLKLYSFCILCLLLALCLPLSAAAAEPHGEETASVTVTSMADGAVTPDAALTPDSTDAALTPDSSDAALTPDSTDAAPEITDGEAGESPTPLSRALALFLEKNAASLLSGATLLFTLASSLLLRKRLMPSLLSALSSLMGKSRDAVESIEKLGEAEREKITSLLKEAERLCEEARATREYAEAASALGAQEAASRKALSLVLGEQMSLLYELLMSANLPQYQKDRIGEAHAACRAALGEAHHEDN